MEKRERKAQLIIEGSDLHEFRLHPNATPEEKEAAKRMAEERAYKLEQDNSDYTHGKYDERAEDEEEDEDVDDEDADMSEEVDEDILMDLVPSGKTAASATTSATAST